MDRKERSKNWIDIISVLRILVCVFATSSTRVRLEVHAGEMKLELQQDLIIAPQFRLVRLPQAPDLREAHSAPNAQNQHPCESAGTK
jgi:hypothetical protein